MTIKEHNRRCGCTPQNPCGILARILRAEHHGGGLFEVTDPGRLPSIPGRGA